MLGTDARLLQEPLRSGDFPSLTGSAARDDLRHQPPLPRAAHLLILRGEDPIDDVLTYQGCAASYLTPVFSSSKAASLETSTCPGQQVTYCCLISLHMPLPDVRSRAPYVKCPHTLGNASLDGRSTKVLILRKKGRLNHSPNLKIIQKPVCVERLFILKTTFFFRFLKYSVKYNIELCLQVSLCMSCQLFTRRYIQSADNY